MTGSTRIQLGTFKVTILLVTDDGVAVTLCETNETSFHIRRKTLCAYGCKARHSFFRIRSHSDLAVFNPELSVFFQCRDTPVHIDTITTFKKRLRVYVTRKQATRVLFVNLL